MKVNFHTQKPKELSTGKTWYREQTPTKEKWCQTHCDSSLAFRDSTAFSIRAIRKDENRQFLHVECELKIQYLGKKTQSIQKQTVLGDV